MKIKFSHYYNKLFADGKAIKRAKLLETIPVNLEDLHPSFIAYDTDNGAYELPKKGKYIMLIFAKGNNDIFTTIRRFTPQKFEDYKAKRGEVFQIIIEEEKN